MANRKANRFEKGTGCYKCNVCSRLTRSTGRGDNERANFCVECYEVAGIENQLSDHGYTSPEEKAALEAEIAALNAACIAKGGKL